jgi:hypothetical protein
VAQNPKKLRVVGGLALGPRTRAIAVECAEGGAFDAAGGRYVIVHTGAVIDGKAIKRAYSLVPVDGARSVFEMVVKRLDDGPGSGALHDAAVGAELAFSGPWGKLVPEEGLPAGALFVATDTGITSALGLVEQHRPADAEVLWLREESDPFLDVSYVRARVEGAGARFATSALPPVRASDRAAVGFALVDGSVAERAPPLVVATGDGAIVHPLIDRLRPTPVRIECYFHNPEKKVAS